MKKLFKRADFLLAAAIVIVAVFWVAIPKLFAADTLQATIMQNGVEIQKINLSNQPENQIIAIAGEIPVKIEVQDGKVRFVASDCADKLCINFGWLSKAGETAACLPAKVVITIEGIKNTNEPDVIAS